MKTEIISFYSDIDNRTYYSDHAKRLQKNCDHFGIPIDIRHLESKEDYRLNCLSKPQFILDMLLEKKKPIVWIDVDSIIHDTLSIFDDLGEFDMAFAYGTHDPRDLPVNVPKASPIYLNFTDITIDFLKYWIKLAKETILQDSPYFDHELLMFNVIPEYYNKMKIYRLNREYVIWPGSELPVGVIPKITMGLADGESKKRGLEKLGISPEGIEFQSPGNKYNA